MAYDPYKSLLANASRDHLKRGVDLNTHLVGNVFLPAIDSQHKKPSASTTSIKHLKVIEQCIMAESKREERLANCATIKERRILTKKFQVQRERERELIQALMLGNYPDQNHDSNLFKTEVVAVKTPRQQLNQDITGLSARVATPDRVFRKADVTGGMPKSKPHAHKQFKLPECNGSPGRKTSAKSQDAASMKLASSRTRTPLSSKTAHIQKRSLSRSAKHDRNARTSIAQVEIFSDDTTTTATEAATSPQQTAQSSCISMHQHQTRSAKASPQLSALPNKLVKMTSSMELENTNADIEVQNEESPALSFSVAQRLAETMGSDVQVLKEKCEKILAEMCTQTTPRVLGDADIKKTPSQSELPPMNPAFVALNQDASPSTPRRPHSDRVNRSTRQTFLENLAKEKQILQDRKRTTTQHEDTADEVDASNDTTHDDQNLTEEEKSQLSEKEKQILQNGNEVTAQHDDIADEVNGDHEITHDDQHLAEEIKSQVSTENDPKNDQTIDVLDLADDVSPEPEYSDDEDFAADNEITPDAEADEELETDVAETLFDIVDMVEVAITEEEKQKVVLPTPRTVSPRPRSSMDRTTKYALRIQSVFRGYRARIAFRLALYEDALSCGVLGAMPGTIQGRSGWYLDPKRLMAYYFVIPDPDSEWEQKYTLRCSRLVLTPYEMQQEVLSKVPALGQDD